MSLVVEKKKLGRSDDVILHYNQPCASVRCRDSVYFWTDGLLEQWPFVFGKTGCQQTGFRSNETCFGGFGVMRRWNNGQSLLVSRLSQAN